MKKILVIALTLLLLVVCCFPLAACGINERTLKNIVVPHDYEMVTAYAEGHRPAVFPFYYITINKPRGYTLLVSSNTPNAGMAIRDADTKELYLNERIILKLDLQDYALTDKTSYYAMDGIYLFALLKGNVCYGYALYKFELQDIYPDDYQPNRIARYLEGKVFGEPIGYNEVKSMFADYM